MATFPLLHCPLARACGAGLACALSLACRAQPAPPPVGMALDRADGMRPRLDLALRWTPPSSPGRPPGIGAIAGRGVALPTPGDPFAPRAGSGLAWDDKGFVGLQFNDGAKLSLRRRDGGLMLTYKLPI